MDDRATGSKIYVPTILKVLSTVLASSKLWNQFSAKKEKYFIITMFVLGYPHV